MNESTRTVTLDVTIDPCPDCPDPEIVRALVAHVLDGESTPWKSVGIILTDHATVLDLNRDWLDHDFHTDVLSFLIEEAEDEGLEGEIYVDVETARERCGEFDASPADEIRRYIIHGLLHLTGYDDGTEEKRLRMRALEDRYMKPESPDE